MRVRISYSVDLNNVPEECSRMLQEATAKINEIYEEVETLVDQLNTEDFVGWKCKDTIDRCRLKLGKIDAILADNDMILEGYFTALESKKKEDSDVVSEG